MSKATLTRIIAVTTIVLGAGWFCMALGFPLMRFVQEEKSWQDYVFVGVTVPFVALPGGFAAVYGYQLLRRATGTHLQKVAGLFAVFGVLVFMSRVSVFLPDGTPSSSKISGPLFVGALVAIPFYALVTEFLIRKLELPDDRILPPIGRGVVLTLSILLWHLLFGILMEYFRGLNTDDHDMDILWDLSRLILPILIAVIFFKCVMKWFVRDRAQEWIVGKWCKPR